MIHGQHACVIIPFQLGQDPIPADEQKRRPEGRLLFSNDWKVYQKITYSTTVRTQTTRPA